ncbi:MAG: hypothetical protein EP318_15550 [Rhodobacteraceae bacterium]|nr:MAG: hypothetical protein EP318_15550 [Paracoccaceae bacterium]
MHIPEDTLRKLANPPDSAYAPAPSSQEAHLLAVVPHMASELLAWRRAARRAPALSLDLSPEEQTRRWLDACDFINAGGPYEIRKLRRHCTDILAFCPHDYLRTAARHALAQISQVDAA